MRTNNLMQLILAVQSYESAYRVYPPGTLDKSGPVVNVAEGYHHNWLAELCPYIEEANTYRYIDFAVGVYHEKNAEVRQVRIETMRCPSDPLSAAGRMQRCASPATPAATTIWNRPLMRTTTACSF